MPCALVHYHEIALKGGNRGFFVQRLVQNLGSALRQVKDIYVQSLPGRIRINYPDDIPWKIIQDGIRHTFGVVNFAQAHSLPINYDSPDFIPLCEAIEKNLPTKPFNTFRVTTKRGDKRFSKTSVEVNRDCLLYTSPSPRDS